MKSKKYDINFRPESYWGKTIKNEMTSQFLSSYIGNEVEIARVTLKSVLKDIISIRARKIRDGKIHYRVVDEHGNDSDEKGFKCHQKDTDAPLTFSELVSLMDTVESETYIDENWRGVTNVQRDRNWDIIFDEAEPEDLLDFVKVTSVFYPQIQEWYEDEAENWVKERLAERKDITSKSEHTEGTDTPKKYELPETCEEFDKLCKISKNVPYSGGMRVRIFPNPKGNR